VRKTGIDIIGDCPWGTHFCQFYQTPQDLADILVPFFKAGLESNESCLWVTSPPFTKKEAESELRQAVPGFEGYQQNGQIEILSHSEWYLMGGAFDLQRVLHGWLDRLEQALAKGFDGLRVTGNTAWLEKRDWKAFADHMEMFNAVIHNHRMIALCSYSLEKCGVQEVLDVVRNHQFALIKSEKGWDVLESLDLKHARAALWESEERYRSLVELSPEGVFINRNNRIVFVNPAAVRLFGASAPEQILGKSPFDIFHPDYHASIRMRIGLLLNGQPVPLSEQKIVRPDGALVEVEVAASPFIDRDGPAIQVILRDITERKQAEEKLAWLASFPELNPSPVVEVDLAGDSIYYLNPAARELFPDLATSGLQHPWLAGVQSIAETMRAAGTRFALREVLMGESCYQQSLSFDFKDQRVRVYGINITPRKRAQEALKKLNEELERRVAERTAELQEMFSYARSLLEASLDPLVAISPDGKITDVNHATELVTGADREQLIGSSFSSCFTEPEKASKGYQKVLSEGLVRDYPLTIRHASGRTTEVLYNATVYLNKAGQIQGVFAAARDVTELSRYRDHLEELVKQRTTELETVNAQLQLEIGERRRAEETLRRTSDELARSNRDLEQFAYVASHDLQEPLRAVAGYVELLQRRYPEILDDKARQFIAGAAGGAVRMQNLIIDLLAFSRVGTERSSLEPTDLQKALNITLTSLKVSIREAGAKITNDPLPTLLVDATQIMQLFQNLIGNAIKFRSERQPEIHVGAKRQPGRWLLSVQDNGIGIDPGHRERIFLIFQRLHTRRKYSGTGIGLAICKRIVERHGGTIWVESKPEQGSTFYFTIPDREEYQP